MHEGMAWTSLIMHTQRRRQASISLQLWWRYERKRWRRKRRRARNRIEVAKALKRIEQRTLFKVIKAWEGWVIWIIEVKEPYNATTIQCWWRHFKVRVVFFFCISNVLFLLRSSTFGST